jgi:hypothetical protein
MSTGDNGIDKFTFAGQLLYVSNEPNVRLHNKAIIGRKSMQFLLLVDRKVGKLGRKSGRCDRN